jgi:2-polyprenyl-3-methyl-5-hydroxy-6-metoxy-1,4-benzoquinol methylase
VAPENDNHSLKTEELTALVREIRDRVRSRYPSGSGHAAIPLADLSPLVHARDAAEAKVAAIGTVNPRRPGAVNALIQSVKRLMARALGWFVRDQVVFNRETVACVEATMEALNEVNRALVSLANQMHDGLAAIEELKDMRTHWSAWRNEWERKLSINEVRFLRSVADLEGAFQHRSTLMDASYREMVKSQHSDFQTALERSGLEIQRKLGQDFERIRTEYERLIHIELRLLRQRSAPVPRSGAISGEPAHELNSPKVDYARLAERFRGSEEYVKTSQQFYVPNFTGCQEVLDIGCGRGEFLELMREAGTPARGIDVDSASVALCVSKGLQAEVADLFAHLEKLADSSLDGIFSAQVVEHLEPHRIPEMVRLAARKLFRGGVIVIETPNPECLAIFATHFYLDPTHTRPIPSALLAFYMEEYGLGGIQVHHRAPAIESIPALSGLPEDFRKAFFGGLDYAIIARKLI